jgi:hypothetical protein
MMPVRCSGLSGDGDFGLTVKLRILIPPMSENAHRMSTHATLWLFPATDYPQTFIPSSASLKFPRFNLRDIDTRLPAPKTMRALSRPLAVDHEM